MTLIQNVISYETIKAESLWVVKMQGWREVGTYEKVKHYCESEQFRDIDTLCSNSQPEHLKPFFRAYEDQLSLPNSIFLLEEFYDKWIKTQ